MVTKRKKKATISASSCRANRQKLPDALKEAFGGLGFVKWTCAYCPVLIVDPMQMVLDKTLPEGIYHAWLYQVYLHSSFEDADAAEEDHDLMETPVEMMPVLIYWFGTTYEFSIVRLSQVMDWKEGCKRGYNVLPKFMERRIQTLQRPVPAVYSLLEDALVKLEERCLALPPEERSLAIFPAKTKKKHPVVLNEWHALAMEAPPQQHSWQEQKELIWPELPHKDRFGQLAFLPKSLWGTQSSTYHHPVLVMDPFRVPPNLRPEWFLKCASGKFVMVYWLGAYTSGRLQQSVYTYHKWNELISYEQGVELGYDKMDKTILKEYNNTALINPGSKRMAAIDWWVCGVCWELPQALEREPGDRWGGLEDFEEDHDDDFEYYWECLQAAKDAKTATNKKRNGSSSKKRKRQPQPQTNTTTEKAKQLRKDAKEEIVEETSDDEAGTDKERIDTATTSSTTHSSDSPQQHDVAKRISPRRRSSASLTGTSTALESSSLEASSSQAALVSKSKQKTGKKVGKEERGLFDDTTSDEEETPRRKKLKKMNLGKNGESKTTTPEPKETDADELLDEEKLEGDDDDRKQIAKARPKNRPPSKRKMKKEEIPTTLTDGSSAALEPAAAVHVNTELREETTVEQMTLTPVVVAAAADPTVDNNATDSDKDVEDAVHSSVLGCAEILKQEFEKTAERRDKRKAKELLSPPAKGGSGSVALPTRIQELKKRKQATEKVVYEAIEHYNKSVTKK